MIYDDLRALFGLPSNQEEPLFFYLFKDKTHPTFPAAWDAIRHSHRMQSFILHKVMFQQVSSISSAINAKMAPPFTPDRIFAPGKGDAFFEFFADAIWVHLKRRDFLAQAVSVYFALNTRVWHAKREADPQADMYNDNVPYKSDMIVECARMTYEESIQWPKFFAHYGVTPHEIYHEDAVARYPDYWLQILRSEHINVDKAAEPRRVVKLGTKKNEIFRERLIEDMSQRIRANAEDADGLAAILRDAGVS